MKRIVVIGGGTVSHVRAHLALCAPAYGTTAAKLHELLNRGKYRVDVILTKMADPTSSIETNQDVSILVDQLIADPDVRCIVFNVALCDFEGMIDDVTSGKYAPRLKTREGSKLMHIIPAEKIIGKIRKQRKDIFVVGFKTTANATPDEQYGAALKLLKENSLNLVLANDVVTRRNVIVAPEETQYFASQNRDFTLEWLAKMTLARLENRFTRSTVKAGEVVPWQSQQVPSNLRDVVNYCIENGAYKPVLGKTAGHFAVKLASNEILTSIRKSNFNDLDKVGLVRVVARDDDTVIAYGAKPSVGGQSQRIVFKEHPDVDCIVHFHCPLKPHVEAFPTKQQWPNECGSHECGANTSNGLTEVDLGEGHKLKVVMLDNHGPNIVFSKDTPPEKVISYISSNFHLAGKTGGQVPVSVQ